MAFWFDALRHQQCHNFSWHELVIMQLAAVCWDSCSPNPLHTQRPHCSLYNFNFSHNSSIVSMSSPRVVLRNLLFGCPWEVYASDLLLKICLLGSMQLTEIHLGPNCSKWHFFYSFVAQVYLRERGMSQHSFIIILYHAPKCAWREIIGGKNTSRLMGTHKLKKHWICMSCFTRWESCPSLHIQQKAGGKHTLPNTPAHSHRYTYNFFQG
jgi:hypothetical protein